MPETAANHKRIARNTMLLYVRMLLIMAVQLFASRVILNTLGVVDYGLYNVVGGIVTLFSFLDAAMVTSTQRYLTFALGTGDSGRLRGVFTTSVQIHAIISIIVLILGETVGMWFFYHKLVIPPDRIHAAMWVFQLSIAAMIVQIMSTPYNAMIIAHERMGIFATISIVEAVLKLLILYLLLLWKFDKLIAYAVLVLLAQLLVRALYTSYCRKRIPESRLVRAFDKPLVKEMIGFAGWNLMGNFAAVMADTGLNLLLNMFFGPAVNAARAVSVQVESAIHRFASGFQQAVNPQITKLYARDEKEELYRLIFLSAKFTFFLLFILMLPVAVEARPILTLWLKIVPDHTIVFMRLMFCITIVNSMANPLSTSAAATGKIKKYQFVMSSILLSIVPLSWIALKAGAPSHSVFIVMLAVCAVSYVVRLFFIQSMIGLKVLRFVKAVLVPCLGVGLVSVAFALLWLRLVPDGTWSWVAVCMLIGISTVLLVFAFGLSVPERQLVLNGLKRFLHRKKDQ